MKISTKDRRIERSRRRLRKALMELILEKGYDTITVEEITERADLGRTTFYLHYKDKEELLLKSLEAVAQELLEQIDLPGELGGDVLDPRGPILTVFQHARDNADLYKIIMNGGAAMQALNQLQQVVAETAAYVVRQREQVLDRAVQVPVDVLAAYFATSLLGFINWWLRRGAQESPEEMTAIYSKLVFSGLVSAFGG